MNRSLYKSFDRTFRPGASNIPQECLGFMGSPRRAGAEPRIRRIISVAQVQDFRVIENHHEDGHEHELNDNSGQSVSNGACEESCEGEV